ncbi:MAG: flagellar basal body rod protein FlgB [Syntrophobacterales bacterium]|nr:MAG: flagellar basal body rod protein FlgB [Syntrophobacterales bacterium]
MPSPSGIFDGTISLLQKSLNVRSVQHQVLSSNVANADTPNYKAFEVAVDEELRKLDTGKARIQLARTQSSHLPVSRAEVDRVTLRNSPAPTLSLRADGNTVDLDRTMGDLSENTIKYKTSAQLIGMKFKSLLNAIQGGK